MDVSDVSRIVKEQRIEFFLAQFVELHGVSKAKLIPVSHLEEFAREGAFCAGFAAGQVGQGPHEPDIAAVPDLNSLTILPWQKNVARFACDIYVEGQSWPNCPRTILRRTIEKAARKGYVFKTGVEPEFFLVRRSADGLEVADPYDTAEKPCYDQKCLTRNLEFLSTLVNYGNELGWDVYQADHEDANGQFEVNWRYADCLTTADRHTFFKYMVSTLAEKYGCQATFMPKPFAHLTGSGGHIHMSLWDAETGRNLFIDEDDEQGLALSKLGYNFIGGLKAHAKAYIAVTAPTVNSYKRLIMGAPVSGTTWAPVYVTYGGNNRTQMLRVPSAGRVEDRTVDAACNPYLAAAVLLAAGLDGIEKGLEAGKRNDRNMYEYSAQELHDEGIQVLPTNLNEALDQLERDEVITEALGAEYAQIFLKTKRSEWKGYHDTVSPWEVNRYLTLF